MLLKYLLSEYAFKNSISSDCTLLSQFFIFGIVSILQCHLYCVIMPQKDFSIYQSVTFVLKKNPGASTVYMCVFKV